MIGELERPAASAADVLEQWPAGYHRFLVRFGTRMLTERPSAVGFRKQFEPFYGTLFKNRRFAPDMGFFREEFVQFGLQHWGRAVVPKNMRFGQKQTEERFVSKSEFARRFRIWKPTMRRMICDGSFVTKVVNTGKRNATVVDLKLSHLPVESTGVVSVRDAADYCGLPVSVLRELRASGVFATKQRLGRELSWHKDDVEEFLRRGLNLAEVSIPASMAIQLRDVMRLRLRDAAAKAEVVAALFDGRLPVVGRVGNNLGGLQIDRKHLNEFILQQRVKVEGNSYSLPEAAVQTGLTASAIPSAVELGLLAATERGGRVRITADAVKRFNAEQVPLVTLAKQLGTSARALGRMCFEQGIEVTTLARTDHSACQLVLSRSLEPKLLAHWKARTDARASRVRDKTRIYEKLLQSYLDRVSATGALLPRYGGNLSRVAIAKACGFHRSVLSLFPSVIALLDAFNEREYQRLGNHVLRPIEALQRYLDSLRDCGALLPRSRRGQLNRLAIARACKFGRHMFYKNPEISALLNAYAVAEGKGSRFEASPLAA